MKLSWKRHGAMLLLMLLVACGRPATTTGSGGAAPSETTVPASGATQSQGGTVTDQVSLIDHLRGAGLTVEIAGEVEQPFFATTGALLRISGGEIAQPAEVQVYNYETAEAAAADARQIGPDGNPTTTMITWVAPPHFFRKERVLALYVGTDAAVLARLTDALGPQFAGR